MTLREDLLVGATETFDYVFRQLANYTETKDEKSSSSYGNIEIDYSILAVVVLTLGLILIVELVRHHIDHLAHGRPFFIAVLESVYAECK
jgi:hypothetical protein